MSVEAIQSDFPNLTCGEWMKTSEWDDGYNCIAFALRDTKQFWDPDYIGIKGYYWPPGIPRDFRLTTLIKLYEIFSFRQCETPDLEPDYEKIAIYATDDEEGTHAARQKASGVWTSKLGEHEDIEHLTPEGLESDAYGKVAAYMKRLKKEGHVYG